MRTWEKNIRKVVPYVPGEQPKKAKMIKLNTNENPYPPTPNAKKVLEEFHTEHLKLYPDPKIEDLTRCISKTYGVKENQVFTGIGSDDVLALAFLTFFNSDDPILFPDITYSFYDVWAELYKIKYKTVALTENFTIDPLDYRQKNGGIIFPNPNAPTGVYESLDTIEEILKENADSVVIVDEAYIDFAGPSALSLVDRYDHLLVVQTFSKSRSMAGVRIGFAIGNEILISYLNDVKYSFNSYTLNELTIRLGIAALEDKNYFEKRVKQLIHTREWTKSRLKELSFSFPDSQGNFIFASHPSKHAKEIVQELKERNIYVRYFDKPRINNYLRITVGTEEEMEEFIDHLKDILK